MSYYAEANVRTNKRNQRTCNKDGEDDHGWRRNHNTCLDYEHDTMNLLAEVNIKIIFYGNNKKFSF